MVCNPRREYLFSGDVRLCSIKTIGFGYNIIMFVVCIYHYDRCIIIIYYTTVDYVRCSIHINIL